ncbi:MAG: tRNA (adenosine(37)-N6)-threonylcarbamoyltransferase complex dimerization subunit type 1 TsaB, partial [Acidimicrobiales bacterium]
MNLLAIESATNLVGAAVITSGGSCVERTHQGGRRHAELLAPVIAEVCALSGLTVQDLDTIAVDVGPGLFTGLRVGVSTAKALAQGLGLGVLAISSLDVLAAGAHAEAGPDPVHTIVVAIDARRGELFAATYRFGAEMQAGHVEKTRDTASDPLPARPAPPGLVTPEELVESLSAWAMA